MKYTSAEAAKLLRKLNDERQNLLSHETQVCEFVASLGEDPESVRPEYDYEKTQAEINETEKKIIKVKHAINVFNSTHKVPDFDMTVDEMLVYSVSFREKEQIFRYDERPAQAKRYSEYRQKQQYHRLQIRKL